MIDKIVQFIFNDNKAITNNIVQCGISSITFYHGFNDYRISLSVLCYLPELHKIIQNTHLQ